MGRSSYCVEILFSKAPAGLVGGAMAVNNPKTEATPTFSTSRRFLLFSGSDLDCSAICRWLENGASGMTRAEVIWTRAKNNIMAEGTHRFLRSMVVSRVVLLNLSWHQKSFSSSRYKYYRTRRHRHLSDIGYALDGSVFWSLRSVDRSSVMVGHARP